MKYTKELSQSITLDGIVPQHIQEDSASFVDFLEAYYDWMESVGGVNNVLHKFGNLHGFVNYFANKTKKSKISITEFAVFRSDNKPTSFTQVSSSASAGTSTFSVSLVPPNTQSSSVYFRLDTDLGVSDLPLEVSYVDQQNKKVVVGSSDGLYTIPELVNTITVVVSGLNGGNYDPFARELYELYVSEYSKSYPIEKILREDIFISSIREVLSCKGSSDSIKTFFRTIYGDEVEIEFPENRRLTYNSQAYYTIKTHIHSDDLKKDEKLRILKLAKGRYFSSKFGTIGQLENVLVHERPGEYIIELQLVHVQGGYFVSGDMLSYEYTQAEKTYFNQIIQKETGIIDFLNKGYGASTDPLYYLNSTLSLLVGGIITGYEISSAGSGYHEGETIVLTSGAEIESGIAIISSVNNSGAITSIQITNSGFGFNAALKIDDRTNPDYTDGLYGGRIYSTGSGAVIRFSAGAASFWDPRKTFSNGVQLLDYVGSNSGVTGSGAFGEYYQTTNSEDPSDPFPYFQELLDEGTYFEKIADSHDPSTYAWVSPRGNDSKNFGKLYFEMQFHDISNEFNPSGFVFDSHFGNTSLNTVGFVSDTSSMPNVDAQLGNYIGTWGVVVKSTGTEFKSEGQTTVVSRVIPTIKLDPSDNQSGVKTVRFLIDLVENCCYVGCHDGWFSGTTATLTALPQTPAFTNITYNTGVTLAASARFIQRVSLEMATRYSQMLYAIPENLTVAPSQNLNSVSSFMYDYDPFKIPVLPWDTSSATIVNDEDEFKLTSEDVVYKYKIKSSISPRIWAKIYKACVHPAGTSYETHMKFSSDYATDGTYSLQVQNVSDWKPIVSRSIKSISDLQEYANTRIDSDAVFSESIQEIKDSPIYYVNQDLIVNCIESVVELT